LELLREIRVLGLIRVKGCGAPYMVRVLGFGAHYKFRVYGLIRFLGFEAH
jgi:hypothetical protein